MELNAIIESLEKISLGTLSLAALLEAILVFLLCYILIRIIMKLVGRLLEKSRLEKTALSFFRSAVKIVLWLVAIIIIADILGIPTTSLVAVLSVAGLALSLSLQNLLSNLFAGITLLATHPFKAGDLIELNSDTGYVREINLLHTKIVTFNNREILIPNSDVTAARIVNHFAEPLRRVDLSFGVSYDNTPRQVEDALLSAAENNSFVLDHPAAEAVLESYGESTISYTLKAWVRSEDYWKAMYSLNNEIYDVFAGRGVVFGYNHINVHMDKG